jgi:hypothetical protein
MRRTLVEARTSIVCAIAFLNRDLGTERAQRTTPQVVAELALIDKAIRAALSAAPSDYLWNEVDIIPLPDGRFFSAAMPTQLLPGARMLRKQDRSPLGMWNGEWAAEFANALWAAHRAEETLAIKGSWESLVRNWKRWWEV